MVIDFSKLTDNSPIIINIQISSDKMKNIYNLICIPNYFITFRKISIL